MNGNKKEGRTRFQLGGRTGNGNENEFELNLNLKSKKRRKEPKEGRAPGVKREKRPKEEEERTYQKRGGSQSWK